ncbi:MAG: hypothetical protein NTY66_04640 [Candidatus Vogelbacteria bacterium]|nr:hypothetical protein [Candidatus Vogelbacteria bacterium]
MTALFTVLKYSAIIFAVISLILGLRWLILRMAKASPGGPPPLEKTEETAVQTFVPETREKEASMKVARTVVIWFVRKIGGLVSFVWWVARPVLAVIGLVTCLAGLTLWCFSHRGYIKVELPYQTVVVNTSINQRSADIPPATDLVMKPALPGFSYSNDAELLAPFPIFFPSPNATEEERVEWRKEMNRKGDEYNIPYDQLLKMIAYARERQVDLPNPPPPKGVPDDVPLEDRRGEDAGKKIAVNPEAVAKLPLKVANAGKKKY